MTVRWHRRPAPACLLALQAALAMGLAGCGVWYDSRLGAALRDCEKQVLQTEVSACRLKLQSQVAAAKRGQDAPAAADDKPTAARSDGCFVRQASGERVCPN